MPSPDAIADHHHLALRGGLTAKKGHGFPEVIFSTQAHLCARTRFFSSSVDAALSASPASLASSHPLPSSNTLQDKKRPPTSRSHSALPNLPSSSRQRIDNSTLTEPPSKRGARLTVTRSSHKVQTRVNSTDKPSSPPSRSFFRTLHHLTLPPRLIEACFLASWFRCFTFTLFCPAFGFAPPLVPFILAYTHTRGSHSSPPVSTIL